MQQARFGGPVASAGGILRAEVKRLLLLSLFAVFLAPADATTSAQPPPLLTYSVSSQSGFGLCIARADGSRRFRLTRGKDKVGRARPETAAHTLFCLTPVE